jgi:hypothetical protein
MNASKGAKGVTGVQPLIIVKGLRGELVDASKSSFRNSKKARNVVAIR